jgi:succinyl-CoA synthetase beta subunit
MVKLTENLGKDLFRQGGIPVPEGVTTDDPDRARQFAESQSGETVLKALVPVGKRGIHGGVRFALSPEDAFLEAEDLLGTAIRGFPVRTLLVERKLDIERELYTSITFESDARSPVLAFSVDGGTGIEANEEEGVSTVDRHQVSIDTGLQPYEARRIVADSNLPREWLTTVAPRLVQLYEVFRRYDAEVVECNPLALTDDGRAVALDAVIEIDDRAAVRQQPVIKDVDSFAGPPWRPATQLEKDVSRIDRRIDDTKASQFIELDGTVGNGVIGGGASLTAMDAFHRTSADPSSYVDVPASENPAKYALVGLAVLKTRPQGLVFGGNISNLARVDVKAKGLVEALRLADVDPEVFPVVVRLAGPKQQRAQEILDELPGIESVGTSMTLEDAVELAVERADATEATVSGEFSLGDVTEIDTEV